MLLFPIVTSGQDQFLKQTTFDAWPIYNPPSHIRYNPKGIFEFILKEGRSQFRSYYRRKMRKQYNEFSNWEYSFYLKELNEIDDFYETHKWHKSWNLTTRKMSFQEVDIGSEHEVLRLGPLSIMNNVKISLKGWGIYFDGEQRQKLQDQFQDDADPEREQPILGDDRGIQVIGEQDFSSEDWYKIKIKPSASIKLFEDEIWEIIRNVSVKLIIKLYYKRQHVIKIQIESQYHFADKESVTAITLSLIQW